MAKKCQSLPKTEPVPIRGSLHPEWKRCGRGNCRCARVGERPHGPYWYRHQRVEGRQHKQYVLPGEIDITRSAIATWRQFHPPARTLRSQLADMRRSGMP
jgi:hypothetical protein